ncbi:MAG TPA: response regulator [Anaerolineae bacterium]|nr:response regulator [Anaerolineae bacterium]
MANILIVDDEEPIRRLLSIILSKGRYEYALAANAAEARKLIKNRNFELILCDVTMPGESGIDFIRHVAAEYPDTAIMMMTAVDDPAVAETALEIGAYGYMIKPFNPNEVLINISNSLRRRELELASRVYRRGLEQKVEERTAELRESQKSLRSIVNKTSSGIIIVNREGVIKFVNPTAEFLFGKKADELIGTIFGLPLVANEKMELNIIMEDGKTGVADMRVVKTNWRGEPACLATLFDVTNIKKAEETLIKANKELVKLAQMKTEFISIASHELRTPLTSIKNAIDILSSKKAGELNAKQEQFTAMAARNIDRLALLLNDIINIAKLDAGRVELDLAELDPASIFQEVVDTFKPQAEAKSQTLEIDYNSLDNVPTVYADYARIEQIMNNLISNALKFTQEGGRVVLSARAISDFDSAIRNPQLR